MLKIKNSNLNLRRIISKGDVDELYINSHIFYSLLILISVLFHNGNEPNPQTLDNETDHKVLH